MKNYLKEYEEDKTMSKVIISIFLLPIILLYALFITFTYQQKLTYFSYKVKVQANHFYTFKVGNDVTEAFILENGSDTDLIYFQGNAMDDGTHTIADACQKTTGYNIVMFIYRGFGCSTGRSSETNIMVDMNILKKFMDRRRTKVNVFGHSLGCAAAVYYASIANVDKLVLNNPFMSMRNVVKDFPFLWALRWLVTEKWQTDTRIGKLDNEILITYAPRDELVDPKNAKELVKICKNGKLVATKCPCHNDALYNSRFFELLGEFLSGKDIAEKQDL